MRVSATAKLRLGWGSIYGYDAGNELTLGSVYTDGSANKIFICGPTADNYPSDTVQIQANAGLSIYSGNSPFPPEYHLHVSGDVGGTGIGDRITLNGTGYLLSGDSPAETQTLQQVCDNGNVTTTSISGGAISGTSAHFTGQLKLDYPHAGTDGQLLFMSQAGDYSNRIGAVGYDMRFRTRGTNQVFYYDFGGVHEVHLAGGGGTPYIGNLNFHAKEGLFGYSNVSLLLQSDDANSPATDGIVLIGLVD